MLRKSLYDTIRRFFEARGYDEVETPTRVSVPAQELHIDAIREGEMYLRTSPEFHMKRLLVDGAERIFQIGPCWRAGEQGQFHNPEFTMLEWYCVGADYVDAARETQSLVQAAGRQLLGSLQFRRRGAAIDLSGNWPQLSVKDLYSMHAGWNPISSYDADKFDIDLLEKIEPNLPDDGAVIVKDYPAGAAAFAKLRGDIAERWELYIGGLEIANAYSELTDANEQESRLDKTAQQRAALGKEVYTQDIEFLNAMRRGLPECAGVALGVDRLLMLIAGADSIQEVLRSTS